MRRGGGATGTGPAAAGRRPILPVLAAVLLSPLLAAPGAAQDAHDPAGETSESVPPLVGDRPDFTESASVVARLQVESGSTLEDAGAAHVLILGELLLRVPAARRLELRVGVPSWVRLDGIGSGPDSSGLADASLGVKVALRDPARGEEGPAVALLAGTTLPTGDEFGSDGLHPGTRLAAAFDLTERMSAGANVGVRSVGEVSGRHAELLGSLSLGVGLAGGWGAYLEAYGFAPTEGFPSSSLVDGGVTWLAGPDLQLDLRLGAGLSGPSPDAVLGAGVVWRP